MIEVGHLAKMTGTSGIGEVGLRGVVAVVEADAMSLRGMTGASRRSSSTAYVAPSAASSSCQASADGTKPSGSAGPASVTVSPSSRPMRSAPDGSTKRTA